MFGLIAKTPPWAFAGFGKHPCAGDFFRAGSETPLLEGFSTWIDLGFSKLPEELRVRKGVTWNFWARGPGGKLVLGHVKSSEDRLGRSHPFLMIGEGKTRDIYTDHWDLWPFFCEKVWMDLTVISEKTIKSVLDLDRYLSKIPMPSGTLRFCQKKRERMRLTELREKGSPSNKAPDFLNKMNNVEGLSRMSWFSVRLDVGRPENMLDPVVKLLGLLKTRSRTEPGAVFIGGGGDIPQMIVFRRSLQPDDVLRLWSGEREQTL